MDIFLANIWDETRTLKLQSCKLYNYKYVNVSTQIANNEIFEFTAVLVLKLMSRKVLFIIRVGYFLRN